MDRGVHRAGSGQAEAYLGLAHLRAGRPWLQHSKPKDCPFSQSGKAKFGLTGFFITFFIFFSYFLTFF